MDIKTITTTKYIDSDDHQEYQFKPIEDTVSLEKSAENKNEYILKYLSIDETPIAPDDVSDDSELFLVHYHRDFQVENDKIQKDDLVDVFRGEKPGDDHYLNDYHIFFTSALIHSGVWLKLGGSFASDPGGWDTSCCGAVLVKKKEFGSGGVEFEHTEEEARTMAQSLIDTWNQYLSGDVYCCVVEKLDDRKIMYDYDIVCGFFGLDYAKECLQNEF